MITRQQIDQLQGFHNGAYLVTSCYLNLDRTQMPAPMLKIRAKDLLQSARHQLQAKAGTHEQRESLQRDLERIEAFVIEDILSSRHKALAIFSCDGEKFWQTYRLPRLVRNIFVADRAPYLRPLTAMLAEYRRYCTILVDRVHGRLFEVYMDEILDRGQQVDVVPRPVREGGFGGRDERNQERRHDGAVHQHLQHVADAAFALFKQQQFDYLVLGGARDALGEFKQVLHPYLKQRWVGDFHAEPGKITLPEVLSQTMAIAERVEQEHEARQAADLVQKASAGDRAVSGAGATFAALTRGEAQTLLVEDGFESPGYVCPNCHQVGLELQPCPRCQQPMESSQDVVDEAVELAMATNCEIKHVRSATALRDAGRIGALLRYRTVEQSG